jgi:hypothetical protein
MLWKLLSISPSENIAKKIIPTKTPSKKIEAIKNKIKINKIRKRITNNQK